MELAPGQALGQYRIVQKIGEGGMGAVYKADQPSVPRAVVIKVLGSSFAEYPDARDRFLRELKMITRLEHPHILPVYDFGEVDGSPYIVMRFMTGGSFQDQLQSGPAGRSQALRLLDQVAQALDFAHDRGIIHRDLKPANILLDDAGNAYLADFGLAKSVGGTQDLTATGSVLGSPAYMSPEQARGEKLDRRSDIYSFAVLIYRALSGHLPFEADDAWGFITKHITEDPISIRQFAPDLPPGVDVVLGTALAKDPQARPDRAADLMANVRAALSGADDTSLPVPQAGPGAAPSTGRSALSGTMISPAAPAGPRAAVAAPRRAPAWLLPVLAAVGAIGLLTVGAILLGGLYLGRTQLLSHLVATYPVGDQPRALLFDGESIWVANTFDNTLTKLAASSCDGSPQACGQDLGTFPVDSLPSALAYDGTNLWVASSLQQTVSVVDPASGAVLARHQIPHVPTAMLWAKSSLWIANEIAGTVTRLSPSGEVQSDIDVVTAPPGGSESRKGPVGLAFDGEILWVINKAERSLVRLDPANAQVRDRFSLEGEPLAIAYDGKSVWVSLGDSGQVVQIDSTNHTVARRIDLGSPAVALMFDGAQLWAAAPEAGKVFRIDPSAAKIVESVSIAGFPVALQPVSCGNGCRNLWTANQSSDTVSRISIK